MHPGNLASKGALQQQGTEAEDRGNGEYFCNHFAFLWLLKQQHFPVLPLLSQGLAPMTCASLLLSDWNPEPHCDSAPGSLRRDGSFGFQSFPCFVNNQKEILDSAWGLVDDTVDATSLHGFKKQLDKLDEKCIMGH